MNTTRLLVVFGIAAVLATAIVLARSENNNNGSSETLELLNVSYDPTRELWRDLNACFVAHYGHETGRTLSIVQSHGGSSSQARAVIDGLEADVVSLALWSDTDAIRRAGLIREGWEERLPNQSAPYYSTIVFVVRQGNPKQVRDWRDLTRSDVQVITPSPKTSGNGKLSFLAAWGSVLLRGGSQEQARQYVRQLYHNTPVLESGARAATVTFAQKKLGDVHLTWENEAHLEIQESRGELQLVYPSLSIKAEPPVAVVDANVDRKQTRAAAEAYLKFVYSDEAQELLASHFYRPINQRVLAAHSTHFPDLELFTIDQIALGWDDANRRFFAEGGLFDQIYQPSAR
jgi:sulfate transport system substrate-binding protein